MIPTIPTPWYRLSYIPWITLGLLGCIATCTAADPTSAIHAYRLKPVSAFDLFLLSTNLEIDRVTTLMFIDGASKNDDLRMLEYISHNFPAKLPSFLGFAYDESSDTFKAKFSVSPLAGHPVFQAGLDSEGDKIRDAFVKEAFQLANQCAALGVQVGSNNGLHYAPKLADGESRLKLL
jgi:hypothetical protein